MPKNKLELCDHNCRSTSLGRFDSSRLLVEEKKKNKTIKQSTPSNGESEWDLSPHLHNLGL